MGIGEDEVVTSTDNPAGRLHQFLAAIRARGNSQNTIATGVIAVWDLNPAVMPVLYDRIAMVSRQPDEVEAQVLALAERKPTLEVNIDGLLEHKNDWERALGV